MKKFLWIAGILVLFFGIILAPSDLKSNNEPFDANIWKNADARTRGQMAKSLVKQKEILNSRSVAQVVELLGSPDLQGKAFVSYQIDFGGFIDSFMVSKFYVYTKFDKETGIFVDMGIADR